MSGYLRLAPILVPFLAVSYFMRQSAEYYSPPVGRVAVGGEEALAVFAAALNLHGQLEYIYQDGDATNTADQKEPIGVRHKDKPVTVPRK